VVHDVFTADDKGHVPSPLPVLQTGREKEVVQQLKQATDTAARLRDELREAANRETQLRRQLNKLQMELKQETHQRSMWKEFDDPKKPCITTQCRFYVLSLLAVEKY